MVFKIGSSWILINVPGDVPCQISHCWTYAVAPFPRYGQNMALLWQKHDHHMVRLISHSWISIIVSRDVPCQISHCWVYLVAPFPKKWPKHGPCMAKTWSKHGPSNWFFLNLNQCAQECFKPNFTILGVSHSPLFLEMAKIWPFMAKTWSSHGPSNWFFLNLN